MAGIDLFVKLQRYEAARAQVYCIILYALRITFTQEAGAHARAVSVLTHARTLAAPAGL